MYYIFSNDGYILVKYLSSCGVTKKTAFPMYPYPTKWSQRKVQFYDQNNADEASCSGIIIKPVVTVNFKRLPRYCTLLHNNSALSCLQYHGSSVFSHLYKQPRTTAIMVIKGIGDLNTEVMFRLLHLKADFTPE